MKKSSLVCVIIILCVGFDVTLISSYQKVLDGIAFKEINSFYNRGSRKGKSYHIDYKDKDGNKFTLSSIGPFSRKAYFSFTLFTKCELGFWIKNDSKVVDNITRCMRSYKDNTNFVLKDAFDVYQK